MCLSYSNVNFILGILYFRFCRKGKVGSYREEMGQALIKRFDEWIAEKMEGVDFRFQG